MYVSTTKNSFPNKVKENTGEDEAIHRFMKSTYLQISHGDTDNRISTTKEDYRSMPQVVDNSNFVNSNLKKNMEITHENLNGVDIPKGTLYKNVFQRVNNPYIQESKELSEAYKERIHSTKFDLGLHPEKINSETKETFYPKENDTSPGKKLVSLYSKRMQTQSFVVGEDADESIVKNDKANYKFPPKDNLMDMKKTNFQFSYQKYPEYNRSVSVKNSDTNVSSLNTSSMSPERNREDFWKNKERGVGTKISLGADSSPTKSHHNESYTWKIPKL